MSNELSTLTATQRGWLALEAKKANTFAELQNMELEIQVEAASILICTSIAELPAVQEKLKQVKEKLATLKDCRLQFTRILDEKLIDPSMQFEKRSALLLEPCISHELSLRCQVNKKNDEVAAKAREISYFNSHFTNEYFRIATIFRQECELLVSTTYIECLEGCLPVEHTIEICNNLLERLEKIELQKPVKFQRNLIGDDEAKSLFLLIPPYIKKVDEDFVLEKFSMYANDLENSLAAISHEKVSSQEKIQQQNNELQAEQATNSIRAQTEVAPELIMTGAKIKKTLVLKFNNDEETAVNVILAFMKNWSVLKPYLSRITSWEKLSLKQMADALGKYATDRPTIVFQGLVFVEKIK